MHFSREFPAVAVSLAPLRLAVADCASAAGASRAVVAAAVQAVHEAAANAVVHAYGGEDGHRVFSVTSSNGDGWLRFLISDNGSGFRPRRTSPGYGLGLAIIAQLADEFEIRDGADGGLAVSIAFRL